MKKILTFFFIFFIYTSYINAASLCSYEEQVTLNSEASNVKVNYEIWQEEIQFIDYPTKVDRLKVNIINLSNNFYVVVSNNVINKTTTYTAKDAKDGIISFDWDNFESVTNFTIKVYSGENTNCANEAYKTLYLTTPRYNEFYKRQVCEEYSDFYLCQKYVTFAEVSEERFLKQINDYKNNLLSNDGNDINGNENNKDKDIIDLIREYKWPILGTLAVILCVLSFKIYKDNKKKKKQRELGL